MGMQLQVTQLAAIIDKVQELEKIEGLDVKEIFVEGHRVFLRQLEKGGYAVIGISNQVNTR